MSAYAKFIAAILGNVVGGIVIYLASAGLATCTDIANPDTCSVLGMSTAQLTAVVLSVFNSLFVLFAPKNA